MLFAVPETPAEWYERVRAGIDADGYRDVDWRSWRSWPFDGSLWVRPLDPPATTEPPRAGAGGNDCAQCERSQGAAAADYLVWRDELFMLGLPFEASSLPLAMFLMTRRHTDLSGLTPDEAQRMGTLLVEVERAACQVLAVPRIQAVRWGDGSEHLHWWLMARPTGMLQLRGTFLSHWDDLLPRQPAEPARADAEFVARRLVERVGGEALAHPGRA